MMSDKGYKVRLERPFDVIGAPESFSFSIFKDIILPIPPHKELKLVGLPKDLLYKITDVKYDVTNERFVCSTYTEEVWASGALNKSEFELFLGWTTWTDDYIKLKDIYDSVYKKRD